MVKKAGKNGVHGSSRMTRSSTIEFVINMSGRNRGEEQA